MPLMLLLGSLVPGLVAKILLAVGFSVVVVSGVNTVAGELQDYVYQSVGGLPADALMLANLAGLGTGMNIILGAITARLALYVLTSTKRIIGA